MTIIAGSFAYFNLDGKTEEKKEGEGKRKKKERGH